MTQPTSPMKTDMKTKTLLLTALYLAGILSAHAYNHKWVGPNYGLWGEGGNWTNNFPNPTEFRAMRLFFPDFAGTKTTYQNVPNLCLDYLEVHGSHHFMGGTGSKLGFRNTNDIYTVVNVSSGG